MRTSEGHQDRCLIDNFSLKSIPGPLLVRSKKDYGESEDVSYKTMVHYQSCEDMGMDSLLSGH